MEERHSVLTKDHGEDGRSSQKYEQRLRCRTKGSAPIHSHTGLPDGTYSTNEGRCGGLNETSSPNLKCLNV